MEMATRSTKPWLVLYLLLLAAYCMQHCVHGESQVPCLFIFGDSQCDSGNNNNLATTTKSNYRPYGIDFPKGPTGRFTNGQTAVDFTTKDLGFEDYIPPYANTSGSDILKGVNYASGAAGILFESGKHMGDNIYLGQQLINHKVIHSKIVTKLGGPDKAKEYLNKCLYYVNIGTNDYINNYFLPEYYSTSRMYTLDQFGKNLTDKLSTDIQVLRAAGARKFVIFGIGFIGCTPNAISKRGTNGECVQEYNEAAFNYNAKLKSLVDQFNNKYSPDSKFIFINSTSGTIDSSLGFNNLNAPCCPTGDNGLCVPNETPCQNRSEYLFYDGFHPTEAAYKLIASVSIAAILRLFQS